MLTLLIPVLLGCSEELQFVQFSFADSSTARKYSYFPIVATKNGSPVLGKSYHKTFDASGYHETTISATYPDNLTKAWRTKGLNKLDRIGIVLLERDKENKPIHATARVYWIAKNEVDLTSQTIEILLPNWQELEPFHVKPEYESD
jgi:hypothetical protein